MVKEWDYPNDVRHEIIYKDGISEIGTIYRISDETIVGRDVTYKPYTINDDITDAIHEGKFQFAKVLVPLNFKGSGSIKTVKEIYDLTISDLANSRNSANKTLTAPNMEIATNSSKYSKQFQDSIIKVFHKLSSEVVANIKLITKVIENANRKNIYSSRLQVFNLKQNAIDNLDKIDKLMANFENPAYEPFRKEAAIQKSQIKNMEVPASAANKK